MTHSNQAPGRAPARPFDPLGDLVVAPSAMPAGVSAINLRTLTSFQRALLTIDGTVTKFIEAYTLQPLETIRLEAARTRLTEDHPILSAPAGTAVQTRKVRIQGRYNRTTFVLAESLVVMDRLPAAVRERLEQNGSSIGRVFNEFEMETRREILWFGLERGAPPPGHEEEPTEVLRRAYRIVAGRAAIALIDERFPDVVGAVPSHH